MNPENVPIYGATASESSPTLWHLLRRMKEHCVTEDGKHVQKTLGNIGDLQTLFDILFD